MHIMGNETGAGRPNTCPGYAPSFTDRVTRHNQASAAHYRHQGIPSVMDIPSVLDSEAAGYALRGTKTALSVSLAN
jgi:hypothetical protein